MNELGNRLFVQLRSLELPMNDYAVFGSGPLVIRGIIEATNDLDVVSRGAAWERACELGDRVLLADYGVEVVNLFGGDITVGTSWAYGDFDINELIETADTIEAVPFVRLEHVMTYKRIAARPKDLEHLRLMDDAGFSPG